MKSSTPEQRETRATAEDALRLKREFLFPCVYHFYRNPPLIIAAEGCELIDADSRRYLDFYSGVTVVNAGHCNREIIEPVVAQMARLDHTTSIYLTAPILRLAEKLATIMPGDIKRSFFCASGSEANEAAMLLAALSTGRSEFIALHGSLHGRTKAAMSATGLAMWRTDPALLTNIHFVAHGGTVNCNETNSSASAGLARADELDRALREIGPQRIAAVIAEPIQGNGGIVIPPADYWPAVREICDRYGVLLIFDEVQTGMNRTGRWWACEHWGVTPDILTTAKALGNGYPIAACVTTDRIAAAYSKPGASTFGGNPVGAVAALATIDFHERNELGVRSQRMGEQLFDGLRAIVTGNSGFARPRGLGLMLAVDVVDEAGKPAPRRLDALLEALKDRGALCGKTGVDRNVLTLMPPLTVDATQVDCFLSLLREAIGELAMNEA